MMMMVTMTVTMTVEDDLSACVKLGLNKLHVQVTTV